MDKKDQRHQVRLTEDETALLDTFRAQKGHTSRSETLRYCFLQVMDNEGDAIGSRRHFSKTMNRRLDEVSQQMAMYHEAMFIALTELFSVLLILLNDGKASEATDPEKARIIKEEMLFYVRQKNTDFLTQLAVNVQGYLALDTIRKNNLELIKGVD